MTLDEIMEKEKFNEVEKALVNQTSLTHAEKIKIISEIKISKSNMRGTAYIVYFTLVLTISAAIALIVQGVDFAIKYGLFDFPTITRGSEEKPNPIFTFFFMLYIFIPLIAIGALPHLIRWLPSFIKALKAKRKYNR
jgi:hypothetical protein